VNPAARLAVLTAMRWFPVGLVVPVLVLLLTARGLTLAQVGQVLAVYSVVTLLLELPTGGLADGWGRRPVVVGSAIVQAAALAGLGVVGSQAGILVSAALLGVARALSSGPVEAWFVDASAALGQSDVESGLARGQIAEALALGSGAVIGGLLPNLGRLPTSGQGLIGLSIPFLVASGMAAVYAVVAWFLLTGDQASGSGVGRTVSAAAQLAFRHAPVRRLMLVAVMLGVLLSGVELVSPERVAQLVGSTGSASAVFGVLTAGAFIVSAAGAWLSTRLPGGRGWVAAVAYLAAGLAVLGLALPLLGAAALTYLVVYLCIGIQGPVTASLLHARIESRVRSTVMSVESLALQAGGAVASIVVGWTVTRAGLLPGLSVMGLAGLVAASILVYDVSHTVKKDD
jgi:MFS family permease